MEQERLFDRFLGNQEAFVSMTVIGVASQDFQERVNCAGSR
jgi:hypothetical protein